jgi:iron-sulfur cluster assembly protein
MDGIKVLVDNISIQYLRGSTINFVNDERRKGFIVENPNVLPACDCSGGSCNS